MMWTLGAADLNRCDCLSSLVSSGTPGIFEPSARYWRLKSLANTGTGEIERPMCR